MCCHFTRIVTFILNCNIYNAPKTIILFGGKAALVFVRSADVTVNDLMKTACAVLNGRGGGQPHQAQGGADVEKLAQVLQQAKADIAGGTVSAK